jgi:hypothetical protein
VSAVTGGLLVGAASGGMLVAAAVLVAWRCAAFRMRVAATHGGLRPPRWMETIRAAVAVAGLALLAFSPAATLPGLVAIVAGEILDRIAFYDALDIVTPRTARPGPPRPRGCRLELTPTRLAEKRCTSWMRV